MTFCNVAIRPVRYSSQLDKAASGKYASCNRENTSVLAGRSLRLVDIHLEDSFATRVTNLRQYGHRYATADGLQRCGPGISPCRYLECVQDDDNLQRDPEASIRGVVRSIGRLCSTALSEGVMNVCKSVDQCDHLCLAAPRPTLCLTDHPKPVTVGDGQSNQTEPSETWSEYSSASTTVQPLCTDEPLCFTWRSSSLDTLDRRRSSRITRRFITCKSVDQCDRLHLAAPRHELR